MAQKITLSIPDMLHEKLKEWRSSFNFSKMFQEAVTDAIQKKEEFQKRFSQELDLSEVIHRLKQEKLAWEKKFYTAGKAEGIKWATSAHYADLLYVLHHSGQYQLTSDPRLMPYFEQAYQTSGLESYRSSESLFHEQMFMDGWFKGVNDFWNQIKGKIES